MIDAFFLSAADLPPLDALAAMAPSGTRVERGPSAVPWAAAAVWFVHPEDAIRGVPVSPGEDGLSVRRLTLASARDLAVAAEVAARLAESLGSTVHDGEHEHDAASLRRTWTPAYCEQHAVRGAQEVVALLRDGGLRIEGVRRSVLLGRRMLAACGGDGARLLGLLRRGQWLERSMPQAPVQRLEPGGAVTATVAAGPARLLGDVDLVKLDVRPTCVVPVHVLLAALSEDALPIDEHTTSLPALGSADLDRIAQVVLSQHVQEPNTWRVPPAAPDAVLLPLLRPPDWRPTEGVVSWSLGSRGEDTPRVSLVRDEGRQLRLVLEQSAEGRDLAASIRRAVREVERRVGDLAEDRGGDGALLGLTLVHELAAEALLSESLMLRAHQRLGARALVVAVPVRGLLRVQDAYPEDDHAVGALLSWAELVWRDAGRQPSMVPISPHLFVVVDGKVHSALRPGRTEDASDDGTLDVPARVGPAAVERVVGTARQVDEERAPPRLSPRQLALASLLLPGLGQWWMGHRGAAVVFFVAEILLLSGFGAVHLAAAAHAWILAARDDAPATAV